MQAQLNKVRVEGKTDEKYIKKLMGKANVIVESANKLWSKAFPVFLMPFQHMYNACTTYGVYKHEVANSDSIEIEMQQELDEE